MTCHFLVSVSIHLPGVGSPLLSAVLKHSELVPGRRKAEVVIMSRNNADTSLRISKSIESFKLDITRGAFAPGAPFIAISMRSTSTISYPQIKAMCNLRLPLESRPPVSGSILNYRWRRQPARFGLLSTATRCCSLRRRRRYIRRTGRGIYRPRADQRYEATT